MNITFVLLSSLNVANVGVVSKSSNWWLLTNIMIDIYWHRTTAVRKTNIRLCNIDKWRAVYSSRLRIVETASLLVLDFSVIMFIGFPTLKIHCTSACPIPSDSLWIFDSAIKDVCFMAVELTKLLSDLTDMFNISALRWMVEKRILFALAAAYIQTFPYRQWFFERCWDFYYR